MKSIYIIIGALLIGFSYLGNSAIIASAQETERYSLYYQSQKTLPITIK